MRRRILLFSLLLLLLPFGFAVAALEHQFLYFPDTHLRASPVAFGLAFQDIEFTAVDGVSLHGWLIPGPEPQAPLVLFCHGNAGDIGDRVENIALLRSLGLAVFIFDYRGYGRSEGRTSETGIYRDVRAALAWLKQNDYRRAQMIYFGRSLGAAAALQLAIEEPPAALVMESPFTSVPAMGRHHYSFLYPLLGWAVDAKYDNLAKIERLTAPLLVIHGAEDRIVPSDMVGELFERAHEPKKRVELAGVGHNDTLLAENYLNVWRDFLKEMNLKARE